jgi:TubC N-terminal docking domain
MTPAALMAGLAARGVRLTALGHALRVDAPRGVLTAADREALVAHKPAVLAALRAEASRTTATAVETWADGVPDGPCGLCGHQPLAEVRDWPEPGEKRWLCLHCAARPTGTLATVHAVLTASERKQLQAEAAAGDPLAVDILRMLESAGREPGEEG